MKINIYNFIFFVSLGLLFITGKPVLKNLTLNNVQAAENCPPRVRCSEEEYPFCIPNVNFNDCGGIYRCWDGDILESLIGNCTYKFNPDPNAETTPWPTPTMDPMICEITPKIVEPGYSGEIKIKHSGIKKGTNYGLVLKTGSNSHTEIFEATQEGLLEIIISRSSPLLESGVFEVRRPYTVDRALICSGAIVVKKVETPAPTPAPTSPATDPDAPPSLIDQPVTAERLNSLNPLVIFGGHSDLHKDGGLKPAGVFNRVLNFLFPLAGLILFVMLVWGGFEMLTGAAQKQNLDAGKQRVTAAITGFILLFVSYWIVQIVEYVTGVMILG